MTIEPRETFRLLLTRVANTNPAEVTFFLRDRDGNVVHSSSILLTDFRGAFKAAFGTSDESLAALERQVKNQHEVDHILRDVTYSSLRMAGLLPQVHVAPKVDLEIHVDARPK